MNGQRLKAEYVLIEEEARLLEELQDVLPKSRRIVLFNLSEAGEIDPTASEFRRKARAALIDELLEYLETELNPPPRPQPRLVKNKSKPST